MKDIVKTAHPKRLLFVVVPREHFDVYWRMPWADVLSSGQLGTDGLSVYTVEAQKDGTINDVPSWHHASKWNKINDVAYLAQGIGDARWFEKAVLYQQNW